MGTMLFSQTFEQSISMMLSEIEAIDNELDELKSKPENKLEQSCQRRLLLFAMTTINQMANEQFYTLKSYQGINFYSTAIKEKATIDVTNKLFAIQKGKAIGSITVLIETINASTKGEGAFTSIDNFTLRNLIPRIEGILELAEKINMN